MGARERLIDELRDHALVDRRGRADERRDGAVLRRRQARDPAAGRASSRSAELVAERARAWGATAVGGLTMGADAPRVRGPGRRRRRQGLLRAQGRQGARAAAADRGPAARARGPLPDRRGRRHHRRARRCRRSTRCARRATRSSASSRSSTAWRAAPSASARRPARALRAAGHDRRRLPRPPRPRRLTGLRGPQSGPNLIRRRTRNRSNVGYNRSMPCLDSIVGSDRSGSGETK